MNPQGQGLVVDMQSDLTKLKPQFEIDHQGIYTLTVLADGRHAAAVLWNNGLVIFDLETGETTRQIEFEKMGMQAITAHPNGRGIWAGTAKQELIYIDRDPDVPVERLKLDREGPLCIEWLEQDGLLAISGINGTKIIKPFGSELRLVPPSTR